MLIMARVGYVFFFAGAGIAWSGVGTGKAVMSSSAVRTTLSLIAGIYAGLGTLVLLLAALIGAFLWNAWPRPIAELSAWRVASATVLGVHIGVLAAAVVTRLGLDLTVGLTLATICTGAGAFAGSYPVALERPVWFRLTVSAFMATIAGLLAALYVRWNV